MNNYSIFISSSDSYSDLWPIFFDLFKLQWPEYEGVIYLNTEEMDFSYEGLNIVATKVGNLGSFGKIFRAGLECIPENDVLLIMIDYIIMGKVNKEMMDGYFNFFKLNNLDSFCLVHQGYREIQLTENKEIGIVIPPSKDMFSYQIAFWKKDVLFRMALPHENPWTSEWFGTRRANKMKLKLACLTQNAFVPIVYDKAGCLHKGKWLENSVEYLRSIGYMIDFSKRGFYKELKPKFRDKYKIKKMLIQSGFRGSYWMS